MSETDWLLFLAQLPATPSSLRVKVWRRLRDAGAASLQNGVWVLPRTEENRVFMERLLAYIQHNGAGGQVFLAQGLDRVVHEDILARFQADRDQEYAEFLEQCAALLAELEKETHHQKFTYAELEENEQSYQRLQKWIAKIQQRDFFMTGRSQAATEAFRECRQRLLDYTRQVYTQAGIAASPDEVALSADDEPADQEKDHDLA